MAVASPSRLGLVQRMTSVIPSSSTLTSNSRTRSWSGPIPSIGFRAPWRTWYLPENSPVFSTETMSRGSSTTQTDVASRRSSTQMAHRPPSATLKHRVHRVIRSLTATIASDRRSASSGATLSRWKVIRWADLGPIPGRRPNSSIRVCSGPEKMAI